MRVSSNQTKKDMIRNSVSKVLDERSVIRNTLRPTRTNTIRSIIFLLAAIPICPFVSVFLCIRQTLRGRLSIVKLKVDAEFGYFIALMEAVRGSCSDKTSPDLILILSRWPHRTLTRIYENELRTRILWTVNWQGLLQQALLLQPRHFVEMMTLEYKLLFSDSYRPSPKPLRLPEDLEDAGRELLKNFNGSGEKLVPLAIHTRTYDLLRNPQYAHKGREKETQGNELGEAIDFLRDSGVKIVMLGSPDEGTSRVPRSFPRLADFGHLGGHHEVLIAKNCDYFWTDAAGAWWLTFPFKKPVLYSNMYTFYGMRGTFFNSYQLVIPVRFKDKKGRELTIREELASGRHFSSREDLVWCRNSAEDLVEAHREMLMRLDGTWTESPEVMELRRKYLSIFDHFDGFNPPILSAHFMKKYPQILE